VQAALTQREETLTQRQAWLLLDLGIALWFDVSGEVFFVLPATALAATPLLLSAPAFKR
jgi:hypothetical protein